MGKAGQLDWSDLERIATIKGMAHLLRMPGTGLAVPAPAASELSTETASASSASTATITTDANRVPHEVMPTSPSNEEEASEDVAEGVHAAAAAAKD